MNLNQNFDTGVIMRQIAQATPLMLLILGLLSFVATGIFSVDYYRELLDPRFGTSAGAMAILLAVIQEAVRFGLLLASVRDFTDSKPFNGWLGLLGSVFMVVHDIGVMKKIGNMWDPSDPAPYVSMLIFLVVIGLLLEVRMILTVAGKEKAPATSTSEKQQQQPRRPAPAPVMEEPEAAQIPFDLDFLNRPTNGNGKHH